MDNPWDKISPPKDTQYVKARRVSDSLYWDLYWARDCKKDCLLILNCSLDQKIPARLPDFEGLRMEFQRVDDENARLILRLLNQSHLDIFYRLCCDIIEAVETAQTEAQTIQRFLNRTWQWHRLLKGVKHRRLSRSELMGLIGELIFLERYLLPNFDAFSAVQFWQGPFGSQKDFECGKLQIEVKAIKDTATSAIAISSEHQLAANPPNILYLCVEEVLRTKQGEVNAFTIDDMIKRIRFVISENDMSVIEHFESCLSAVGYDFEHDYSDYFWLLGKESFFLVDGDFPRVTPSMYPIGVEGLRYSILLEACSNHLIDKLSLISELLRSEEEC